MTSGALPTLLLLNELIIIFLFVVTAAGVVPCGHLPNFLGRYVVWTVYNCVFGHKNSPGESCYHYRMRLRPI